MPPPNVVGEAKKRFFKRGVSKSILVIMAVILVASGTGLHFFGHGAAQSLPENCFASPGLCGYPDPAYNNDIGPTAVGVADCDALPNFSTADLPAGTYYSGSGSTIEIVSDNVTLNRLNMDGFGIYVSDGANNFTLENSCVQAGDGTDQSIGVGIAVGVSGTTIEDDTISGAGTNIASSTSPGGVCTPGPGVSDGALGIAVDNNGTNTTINGVYIYDAGGGAPGSGGGTNATVENSYELVNTVPACEHDEDVYFSDLAITLHHNVLFNEESQTAAVFGDTSGSACDNQLTMTDNFIAGGDYVVYPCANSTSVGTGTMDIENNRFTRCLTTPLVDSNNECSGGGLNGSDTHGYYPDGGFFGVAAYYYTGASQTWTNNYWDDNLDQVNIDGSSGTPVANPGPAVALTGPIPDAVLSNTVSITATASTSSPATVHDVQFQVGSTDIPGCDPTTPNANSNYVCNWNTSGVADGSHTITAIVTDSNNQTATSTDTIIVQNTAATTYTIWHPSDAPVNADTTTDSADINLGTKFQSNEAGYIVGVRFYKGIDNTGTHIGALWTGSGTLLSSVTFTNETASGWQQAYFPSPVAISANTTYLISYLAPNGNYAADHNYFNTSLTNGPLTALQNNDTNGDGGNGVYAYNSGLQAPNDSFLASNYWVDAMFTPSQHIVPTVSFTAPTSGATVTGTEPITINATSNDVYAINDVQFQADGTDISNCDPTTPISSSTYECSAWNTSSMPSGIHTVQVVATDSNNDILTTGEAVTVNTPTPTVSISAAPTTIAAGGSSILTWNSTNAATCTASGAWSGNQAVNNTSGYTVDPTTTSTYTLICSNPSGASPPTHATVTVVSPTTPASGSGSSSSATTSSKPASTATITTTPAADTTATSSGLSTPQATSSTTSKTGQTASSHATPSPLQKTSKHWQLLITVLVVFGVACIVGIAVGVRRRHAKLMAPPYL